MQLTEMTTGRAVGVGGWVGRMVCVEKNVDSSRNVWLRFRSGQIRGAASSDRRAVREGNSNFENLEENLKREFEEFEALLKRT